jgi:hypothetical protein
MSDLGRYRKLYARLWRHPGFAQLSDGEKVLAFYVLTGPQTNRLGLYVLSIATAAEDLGTVPETLSKRLVNVCQTFGWQFDKRSRVFFCPSWFRWNPPENLNVMKGSLKDLNEIPPCALVDAFARNIETVPETLRETFLEGLRQRLPKPSPNQEPYPYPYPERKQKQAALRAVAETGKANETNHPTPDERMLAMARATIRESPQGCDTDYLIEVFLESCNRKSIKANRQLAILALGESRQAATA